MIRWVIYTIVYFVFTWIALYMGAWMGIKGQF